MKLKIACDNQVTNRLFDSPAVSKYKFVLKASDQPDEVWIEQGLAKGANVIIGMDIDIPLYLDRMGYDDVYFVEVKQGLSKGAQVRYIVKKLKTLEAMLNETL